MQNFNKLGRYSKVFEKVATEAVKSAFYKMKFDARFKEIDKDRLDVMFTIISNEITSAITSAIPNYLQQVEAYIKETVDQATSTKK